MRLRSISLPNLQNHDELGAIIGTVKVDLFDLETLRKGIKKTALIIDDNLDNFRKFVDLFNIFGKYLVVFTGMLVFLSVILHSISGF